MASTMFTIVFRLLAIFSGVFLAIMSYLIYKNTRGATKGYSYLAYFGISLFLWSSTAMIFKKLEWTAMIFKKLEWFLIREISGIIFLFMIGFFVTKAFSKLVEDFGVTKPSWVSVKGALYFVVGVHILVLALNLMFFFGDFLEFNTALQKLLSIAHWSLSFSFLYAIFPTYYLMKATKKSPWILAFLFSVVIAFSLNIGQYYDGCCGISGKLSDQPICEQYDLDYMRTYDVPCNTGIVKAGIIYQMYLIVGIILIDVSFFQLWRRLS